MSRPAAATGWRGTPVVLSLQRRWGARSEADYAGLIDWDHRADAGIAAFGRSRTTGVHAH
jgi:hypothetical protein